MFFLPVRPGRLLPLLLKNTLLLPFTISPGTLYLLPPGKTLPRPPPPKGRSRFNRARRLFLFDPSHQDVHDPHFPLIDRVFCCSRCSFRPLFQIPAAVPLPPCFFPNPFLTWWGPRSSTEEEGVFFGFEDTSFTHAPPRPPNPPPTFPPSPRDTGFCLGTDIHLLCPMLVPLGPRARVMNIFFFNPNFF